MPLDHWGACVITVLGGRPLPTPAGKRGQLWELHQRSCQVQASRQSHCLFTDPLGCQHCLLSWGELPSGSRQQRRAFPAGEDDPVDQRLLTGSLSACLVSKYKPISGNVPFPLGQAEDQYLCCDRLLISVLLPILQRSHAQKHPFPFLKAWVFVLLDIFFFNYTC